jgi:hypothetical protein
MYQTKKKAVIFALQALVLLAVAPVAFADHTDQGLQRVGPVLETHGYPSWYQDKTGVVLEFCQPLNQQELDGGWCLLLPGDTVVPEVFPDPERFADEHFYWAGDAAMDAIVGGTTVRARLILALEAAFTQGPVVPGDQTVFGRVRIRIDNLPFSGTYTVYHPYGTEVYEGLRAGDRLFVTEDIGFNCNQGQFDCALASRIGPFLLPSNTPGGAELAPIQGPVPGKLYIADPARSGPVTGSPLHTPQNYFRVEGPNGFLMHTNNFTLMGRMYQGTLPAQLTVDRATYSASASGNRLDVFATAFAATQPRIPGQPRPPVLEPVLSFFPAPCVKNSTGALAPPDDTDDIAMYGRENTFWGQSYVAEIPEEVCVEDETARNAAGQVVPAFFRGVVTDQVTITEASYDAILAGGTLTVRAFSSDPVGNPELKVGQFNGRGEMMNGVVVITELLAPPSRVRVFSEFGGFDEVFVTVADGTPVRPVAVNDVAFVDEGEEVIIDVLNNDTYNGTPIAPQDATVTIVNQPRLGTALVNPDQTITFTANLHAFGVDGIAYTVSVGGVSSSLAYVTININAVDHGAPTANNDATIGIVGVPVVINVVANDTDPDGAADIVAIEIVPNSLTPTTATLQVQGTAVVFTASAAATYNFRYVAIDQIGNRSNEATVTVVVNQSESISIQVAEYRTSSQRLRVSGTASPAVGQTLRISWDNGSEAGTLLATAVVQGNGNWAIDIKGATGVLDPRTSGATRVRVNSELGGFSTAAINVRN